MPNDQSATGMMNLQPVTAIEKADRIQSLVLRGARHPSIDRQILQIRRNLAGPHLHGMPIRMMVNEPADPLQISLFCAEAVALRADLPAHTIQQRGHPLGPTRRRSGS